MFEIKNRLAFTLAEVVITLGIIGVVAAMTMPSLITSYQKRNAEAHLKHFYSLMRQGIEMTANEPDADCEVKQSQVKTSGGFTSWWDACLGKVLKTSYQERKRDAYEMVVLLDGSAFVGYAANTTTVHFFYCTSVDKCGAELFDGRTSFLFTLLYTDNGMQFYPSLGTENASSRATLLSNCRSGLAHEEEMGITITRRHTCTALIMRDGWKIAPDYPWQYTARQK